MNFAIKEPWYSKIFSFQNQEKQNTTPQPLLFFEKSFFVDNEITMAIEFDKEYINKIKKENREINQNIFYDFNCNEYKYPQLVLEQLKTNYIFNAICNNIIDKNSNLYQVLIKKLNQQQINYLKQQCFVLN